MIPESLVAYQKASNTMSGSRLPKWVYEQTIKFPHHPRRSELIEQYQAALIQHSELVKILQFAITTSELTDSQKVVEIEACQRRVQAAKEQLQQAEQELRNFCHYTPRERIEFIQLQIADLEMQLLEVHALEQRYVNQLLNDPELNKRKLDRLVFGHTGLEAEYSASQLDELRSLRSKIQSIEAAIINSQWDVERIRELADEQRKIEKTQAVMDVALPKFHAACSEFSQAWIEMREIAGEHNVNIYDDFKIPNSIAFEPSENKIILLWE